MITLLLNNNGDLKFSIFNIKLSFPSLFPKLWYAFYPDKFFHLFLRLQPGAKINFASINRVFDAALRYAWRLCQL
jgi:hypothetical protein